MSGDIDKLIADVERLRGKLRISVLRTGDGLGILVPPARRFAPVAFLLFWLCGWAMGEYFALSELLRGGLSAPDLFLLIWLVPWTLGGAGVLWVVGWQLFGVERLFFTANALVREWSLLGMGNRRVVHGAEFVSVKVDGKMSSDLAGIGSVQVTTTGKPMRIGSGLDRYEAELVASLIEGAASAARSPEPPDPKPVPA